VNVAVIGSRTFNDYNLVEKTLSGIDDIDCIVSGGAKGADSLGEEYALNNSIKTMIFKPDWKRYGRGAGFVRNKTIIDNADVVVAFWDLKSKGTKNSIELAKKQNKKVVIIH
jgi:predicted Rossmann fold nucleotide-binding protein DprA/Smf involved in DNA uptake